MLHLNLAAVDRGEVSLREQVPPDHPMWNDTGVELTEPLEVDLTANSVGEGVLVRGTLRTKVRMSCRRCLEPVDSEVDEHVDLLFAPPMADGEDVDDGEVYPLPARGDDLDLTGAVREQVLLQAPQFTLCREDCRGLCPTCGRDLNQGSCECVPDAAPGPWDALKNVKFD
ncbi:DUF177 domain-containing protein [Longimicrobium sp.]|uniref:YceD family protein n=1 Tax=Longimicrobium sp. TaxID=2029185 RepID=UPI002C5CF567|nr:DUF177 domain-containing protein [Longimicrobium sp.]HSU12581.1 DUF177 domain-containing protein [Longimicrobium sp.]